MNKTRSDLHIVLIEPEIPQNTGNIGRTCLALKAELHLVGRMGFSLEEKNLKRAGLDYWKKVRVHRHENWPQFLKTCPKDRQLSFFSTKGKNQFWDRSYRKPSYLIFGSESRGLPPSFYITYQSDLVLIPQESEVRSLNLSTAVGVAAYEATRQFKSD